MLLETNNNIRMLLKTNILKEIIQIKGKKTLVMLNLKWKY